MNRQEEYLALLNELDNIPKQLDDTIARAEARLKSVQRKRRCFTSALGGIASFLIVLTLLVNFFPTIAYACGRIPLIKNLAQLVAFSPSLSAAVENEYVQPLEQEQTRNGITARIEYVIVDQKQLNIFFSLNSDIYSALNASPEIKSADGTALEGYCISYGDPDAKNGQLTFLTVDFTNNNVPKGLHLILNVHDNGSFVQDQPVKDTSSSMLEDDIYEAPEYISTFSFPLEFDPYYTAQGEVLKLNHSFEIDGQTLTVTTAEIYPTQIRFKFEDDKSNTAWMKSLDFYLENEKGKRFNSPTEGITATGSVNSPMMEIQRLESSFFSQSKKLTMHITGVTWLDKNMERIRVDLTNKTAEALPQGVIFESADYKTKGWILTFSAVQYEEITSYQLFDHNFYDEAGNEYFINSWSSGMTGYYNDETGQYEDTPGRFTEEFPLKNYPYDVVYLSPSYSRMITLKKPIIISVK